MYPSNVCWVKNVIAKATKLPKIVVKKIKAAKKIETFQDVLE